MERQNSLPTDIRTVPWDQLWVKIPEKVVLSFCFWVSMLPVTDIVGDRYSALCVTPQLIYAIRLIMNLHLHFLGGRWKCDQSHSNLTFS